ncbi:MAG: fibronectin type III domain-containing protein [Nitrospiraceae bacterium]
MTLTWTANGEPDLAGYKVYVGTASGTYSFPGSPFVTGKVTSYTISNLPKGQTYFFAISAYDTAGNESPLSAEVSKSIF